MTNKKISEDQNFPRVMNSQIEKLLKTIEDRWKELLKKRKGQDLDQAGVTLHKLKEALIKLDYRYSDLVQVFPMFDSLTADEMGEPLHYLQVAFVDRVEAFHQQIYSTISTLILVLNHFKDDDKGSNHPIGSVKQFLDYIKDNKLRYRSTLINQVDCLQRSRDFRSKFIDHPQQHQLHDWMTFRAEDGIYLIFFVRKGNEVYAINPIIHPFDPEFKPPINCGKDFYIAPSEKETIRAIVVLIGHILDL